MAKRDPHEHMLAGLAEYRAPRKAKLDSMPTAQEIARTLVETCRTVSDADREQGCDWYPTRARAEIVCKWARLLGLRESIVAGVIAAHQSNNSWQGGLDKAWDMLVCWVCGYLKRRPRVGDRHKFGTRDIIGKAWAILQGEEPLDNLGKMRKIPAFYRNLMGDYDTVTVDRWAVRAAGCPKGSQYWKGGYDRIAEGYALAADELGGGLTGFTPSAVQAIAWVAIRGAAH